MLMQLIHGPTDLDRLRGAFNWKDGAVYFPPTHLTVSTYSIASLASRMTDFSFNISFEGLPTNLGTWSLWSPKSGLNIPPEPQRRLALFCGGEGEPLYFGAISSILGHQVQK